MFRRLARIMNASTHRMLPERNDLRRYGWRMVWVVLLAIHAGAVPMAVRGLPFFSEGSVDAYSVFRFGGLLVAAAFCLLKVADVAWLRVRPGRSGSLSIAVVLALLHAGTIQRVRDGEIAVTPSQVGVFLFVGTSLQIDLARRSIRILVAELRATHDRTAADRPLSGAAAFSLRSRRPLDPNRFIVPLAPRPPPCCCMSLVS